MREFVVWTGLAVLAWFFVVPSCSTSFGCEAAAAVAYADSDECPSDIDDAVGDAQWAAARLATIKDTKITTGLFYDEDGTEHTFTSGRDKDSDRATTLMQELGIVPGNVRPNVADHVETKVATLMRDNELGSGVLVINFPRGVCGVEEPGPYSCSAVVPSVVPEGATLAVWSPREIRAGLPSVKLEGNSR